MEEMKPGSYPFRFRKQAPSENQFMKLLEAGIKNTKPEGVMTARNERIMQLDSLIDPDMDPGDLRTIYDDMMRESGGNYPGVDFDTFLKSIGTRTASNDEAVRQLENLFEMFKDQGMSDEEAEKAARERMESAAVRKAAEGGIVSLDKGGDPSIELINQIFDTAYSEVTPSEKTGSVRMASFRKDPLAYDKFLKKLDFTKPAESKDVAKYAKFGQKIKVGDLIGSRSAAANALDMSVAELTNEKTGLPVLNKLAKDKGFQSYMSLSESGKGARAELVDFISGKKYGEAGNVAVKTPIENTLEDIKKKFKDEGPSKNKSKKIFKEIIKAFPTLKASTVGLTLAATTAAKTAFGGPLLDLAIPTEMGIGTMMSPEDEALLISKEKIKEKFK